LFALATADAAAAEAKTPFQVLVASVSKSGSEVSPELARMSEDFKRNGLSFTSFKLVSKASLSLAPGQTDSVKLPNGAAKISLIKVEASTIRLKVAAPFSTSEYSMTPGGEIYIDTGAHGATKIFLAVKR
jgi:hypothetical protein